MPVSNNGFHHIVLPERRHYSLNIYNFVSEDKNINFDLLPGRCTVCRMLDNKCFNIL